MSKVCGKSKYCMFAPEQNTGGCPCAETCPYYCKDSIFVYSTTADPCVQDFWTDNKTVKTDYRGKK